MRALKLIIKRFVFVFSILVLAVLHLVKPLVRVRLMIVGFHKFGHLALEPDLALLKIRAENATQKTRLPINIYFWGLGPRKLRSNQVLAAMWSKQILVIPSWLIDGLVKAGETFRKLSLVIPKLSIHGPANLQASTKPTLQFTADQIRQGEAGFLNLGMDMHRPYVCLVVRDSGHNSDPSGAEHPEYEFRNFDVDTFADVATALVGRGYQVVRMGAGKEKPFSLKADGVFDYATSRHRTELMDVFLAANCSFAVSTQTGPDAVCLAFRRPVCFVDIPIFSQFFFGSGLAYWNPTIYVKNSVQLTLKEIVNSELMWIKTTDDLLNLGITGIRSTPLQITENVLSFLDLYENDFKSSEVDNEVSELANAIVAAGMGDIGRGIFGDVKARFNPAFLRRNADWFLR